MEFLSIILKYSWNNEYHFREVKKKYLVSLAMNWIQVVTERSYDDGCELFSFCNANQTHTPVPLWILKFLW